MKYWLYLSGEVPGTYTAAELAALPGVLAATLVCPAGGKILEKNWRPCSEFPEIATALKARDQKAAAAPKKPEGTSAQNALIDQYFDSTSQRLFQHVNELMRELDVQRGQGPRIEALEKEIAELKEQLRRAEERRPS